MTYMERMVIRRGHPKYIIVGIVGFLWFVYLLWQHDWTWALTAAVLSAVLGRLSTPETNDETLAATLWRKIMLWHLHPMNLSVQIAGLPLLFYGSIWFHSTIYIMVATSIVLLGHMW